MHHSYVMALAGGALIGLAAGMLLLLSGRIAGVSGIIGGALARPRGDTAWRLCFAGGLLAGGLLLAWLYPSAFPEAIPTHPALVVAAGLLVGFGTGIGNGCTSGHGVCGIGRLSPRSVVATVVFIAAGVLTVLVVHP